MSPLALLQEGEVAEIIDPLDSRTFDNGCGRHHHRHGKGCPASACLSDYTHASFRCCLSGRHSAHLQDMGLRPGKKVEMITNSGTGPLILRVDECRIAMGRGAAMKIYVRRNGQ